MATTREGGAGVGRAPKGSSSSNPQTKITNKPSTKPSNPSASSSSSNKLIPNYLKPTISSSLDPSSSSSSRIIRRSSTFHTSSTSTPTTTTTKPASVNRRRSLDKPPSSSTPQNTLRGPTKPVSRATSSNKTTLPSAKPAPQRSLSSLSYRSIKPASTSSTTPSIRRSLSTKATTTTHSNSGINIPKAVKKTAPKSVASDTREDLEARDKDLLELGSMDDHEVLSLPEISEMPGQEDQLGDPVMLLPETAEEQLIEDANECNKESVESEDGVETEEKGTEEDLTSVEEKHVVVVLEGSSADDDVAEATESPLRHQTQGGNKKEGQAYNDVIEETASKLMRSKSNKVMALAGAFETVISLDSK